jgi:hypothetical protein
MDSRTKRQQETAEQARTGSSFFFPPLNTHDAVLGSPWILGILNVAIFL